MRVGILSTLFIGLLLLAFYDSQAQYDDNIVVAQEWEGIYEILLRNDLAPTMYIEPYIQLNRLVLEDDTLLIAGDVYQLPGKIYAQKPQTAADPESNTYPIFAEKYQNVPTTGNRLKGEHYYLVSGHG